MKKSENGVSLRQSLAAHLRAAKLIHKELPHLLPATILSAVVAALTPYATIYLSAQLINELASLRRSTELTRWVLLTLGVTAGLGLLQKALTRWQYKNHNMLHIVAEKIYTDKFLTMDYADADRQEVREQLKQILQSTNWSDWGLGRVPGYFERLVSKVAAILGAVALTVSLFTQMVPDTAGKLTVLNNPLFALLGIGAILAAALLSAQLSNRAIQTQSDFGDDALLGNRLFSHFGFDCRADQGRALDMRVYDQFRIAEYYMQKINIFGAGSVFDRNMKRIVGPCFVLGEGLTVVFSGLVYLFVCLKALAGAFGVGSVTQYVSAVTTLSDNVSGLLEALGEMNANTPYLEAVFRLLDIPNAMYQGSLTTEKRSDRQYEVEFRDVSFKYPGAEVWSLRHVNMKFKVGKRLAIVGENGSGKTTFIKLLCRLYDPQEGQILLNGIDIRKYKYDDYMDIFSVVFQDFQLICQPLGDNVAGSVHYDRERVKKALCDAGFGDRLQTMEKGLDTMLYKDLTEDGVDVSGGEAQKIAIARALYKDAPFIILDEPTAALDPIAEAEIYSKFNDIAGDKTAIYISHRLSSCKFCDEIAVFHEGTVIQQGSHETLVADTSGKYYELWNAQAQYYTE